MRIISSYIEDLKHISKNAKLFIMANLLFAVITGATWTGLGIIFESAFDSKTLGIAFGMHSLGMTLSALPISKYFDRLGHKKIFLTGSVLGTICLILNGFIQDITILYIVNLLFGFALGIYEILPAPFISSNTNKKQRNSIMAIMFSVYWIAIAIVSKLSGGFISLIQIKLGIDVIMAYKYYTFMAAGIGLLSVIPIMAMDNVKDFEIMHKKTTENRIEDIIDILNKTEVRKHLIYICLIGLGAGLFSPFFANYFINGLNIGREISASILSVQYFAIVIGVFICPIVVKRFGRQFTLGMMPILSVPFMLIIANSKMFGDFMIPILSLAFFMRSGLVNLSMPLVYGMPLDLVKEDQKVIMASIQAVFNTTTRAISSILAGYLMGISEFKIFNVIVDGYTIPYYIASFMYVLASIVILNKIRRTYLNKKEVKPLKAV